MAESSGEPPAPLTVEYDPITGVPAEFNEFLPKDCDEYKRWKAAQEQSEAQAAGVDGAVADLSLTDKAASEAEKKQDKSGKKKKAKPQVIIDKNTRNKRKCVTTVFGLDSFGVKLSEAAKLFGKKFASGAAVVKNPSEKEQIDIQGDVLDKLPDFILKNYAESKGIKKSDIWFVVEKRKQPFYPDEE